MRNISKVLLIVAVVALASTISMAGTVLCTEGASGCTIQLPFGGTVAYAGSDGETPFDPWGVGYDTSDELALDGIWVQSAGSTWTVANATNPPFAGAQVWVLSACNPSGCENANISEPVGMWDAAGYTWNFSGTLEYDILDPDGTLSDTITIGNFGPGGDAGLKFKSGVPEPATLTLLGSGFLGIVGVFRRKLAR